MKKILFRIVFVLGLAILFAGLIGCSKDESVEPQEQTTQILKKEHIVLFTILPRDKQLDYIYEVGVGNIKMPSQNNDTVQGQFKFPMTHGFTSNKISDLYLNVKAIAIRSCPVICKITVDGVVVAIDSIRKEDAIKKVVYLRYKIVE